MLVHDIAKPEPYSLDWFLSCVDHPVHSQVMGTLEGSSTKLTDIIPLVCGTQGEEKSDQKRKR